MKNIKNFEILSPVGNKEMLISAVRSGADAVYLGAKDFSARRNAENFGDDELESTVKYCHIRGVKVYLTLNIMIKNSELEDAFNLAKKAYNIGVDGIIIQDLGLASVLREKIPELPLHASTQLTVHSPSALCYLKEKGFKRVVVAREVSKEQLAEICKKAEKLGIEIEAFIHGALCMCMSGQCLLSAFLGGRSGNRGLCAGPCRLPFGVSGGSGYDLSLKDLSLMEYIREMAEMGVCSFKIEGRMKRPEYVAAATSACRKALDNGKVDSLLSDTLKNVFSRSGFTDGYYLNKIGRDMFGIRTKEDVISADKAFPTLHEIYRNERQSVNISVNAEILENEPMSLTLSDGENTVTVSGDIPQKALNQPINYENVYKNINKFGSTPYRNEGGAIHLDDGLFVSAGSLNALRREAVSKLDELRARVNRVECTATYEPTSKAKRSGELRLIARFSMVSQMPDDLKELSAVIIPLEENPPQINNDIIKIVDIPRGISDEEIIRKRLQIFKENGFNKALCGNLSAVWIANEMDFEIIGDTGLNISNSETVKTFSEFGVKSAVLSSELTLGELEEISGDIPLGMVIYGKIPLMLFKNCPIKNGKNCKDCDKNGVITDRMGVEFPIRCRLGFSEMFNSVPIWLADRKKELNADFGVLYFTDETRERVREVISAYKKGLSPDIKHTRGLYYRGIL